MPVSHVEWDFLTHIIYHSHSHVIIPIPISIHICSPKATAILVGFPWKSHYHGSMLMQCL